MLPGDYPCPRIEKLIYVKSPKRASSLWLSICPLEDLKVAASGGSLILQSKAFQSATKIIRGVVGVKHLDVERKAAKLAALH